MATLRLFANLRESAGTDRVDIEAATVGDLLDTASARFGDSFTAGLGAAGVWVNGETASSDTTITSSDEVAVIPPVSGGTVASPSRVEIPPNLLSVALVISLLAVAWADPAWLAVVGVGAILAWVWDLSDTAARTRDAFVVYPPLLAATAGGAFAYAWGIEGFAGAIALSTELAVSWPIFDRNHREFRTTSATTLVSVVATSATAGLVLIRLEGTYALVAFVLITAFALVGGWVAAVYGASIQSIDANVGSLLGALLGGLIGGLVLTELEVSAGLLGGVAVAAGVIAGRALGSMLRTGAVSHTEQSPGALSLFDGAVVAAPLFWIILWLFG